MAERITLWAETDATLEAMHTTTPRSVWVAEAEDNYMFVPATPVWDESLSPIPENDHATSNAQMGLYADISGLSEPEDGQSEALTLPTADGLDYRFWGARYPFALTHSELVGDSHSMLVRQLSNQAGLSSEMRLFSDDASSAASDASSVTLQGDDMSQSQIDEKDDHDYEATSSRRQHLYKESQELLNMISGMCDTLPKIEKSYEALELRAHSIEHERIAKRTLCFKVDQMILRADIVNQRPDVSNSAAAELDMDVDMINNRAMELNREICNVNLDAWKSKLKTRKRKHPRISREDCDPVLPDYAPVPYLSPQEPLRGYLVLFPYTPDKNPMEDRSWDQDTARTSSLSYSRPTFPYDLPPLPAAGMQDPPLQHAGWDGPSAYHDYDHSTSRYQPLISDPVESYLDSISAPQNSPQASPQAQRRKSRRSRSRSPFTSCYQSERPCYNNSN
jgi:hypothetical protein